MTTRKAFLEFTAGLAFVGCDLLAARPACAQAKKTTVVGGTTARLLGIP